MKKLSYKIFYSFFFKDLVTFEREIHHDICIVECQQYNDSGKNDVIGVGYFSLTKALL